MTWMRDGAGADAGTSAASRTGGGTAGAGAGGVTGASTASTASAASTASPAVVLGVFAASNVDNGGLADSGSSTSRRRRESSTMEAYSLDGTAHNSKPDKKSVYNTVHSPAYINTSVCGAYMAAVLSCPIAGAEP
jgi:hypothetical protein